MVCPSCEHPKLKTVNSRKTKKNNQVWRRRQCESCGRLFTTREYIDLTDIAVIKNNGKAESYSRAILLASLLRSLDHVKDRPVESAYALSETIEQTLYGDEITTKDIVASALKVLQRFDEVSAIKYKSYYA